MLGKLFLGSAVLGALLVIPGVTLAENENEIEVTEAVSDVLSEEELSKLEELNEKYDFTLELGEPSQTLDSTESSDSLFSSVDELEEILIALEKSESNNPMSDAVVESSLANDMYTLRWNAFFEHPDLTAGVSEFRHIDLTINSWDQEDGFSGVAVWDSYQSGGYSLSWEHIRTNEINFYNTPNALNIVVYGEYSASSSLGPVPINFSYRTTWDKIFWAWEIEELGATAPPEDNMPVEPPV